jgi:hypothetical protein
VSRHAVSGERAGQLARWRRAPEIARLRGIALAGVFQIIIAEAGRRTREGQSQDQIADELRPAIEAVLDDLDAWLTPATEGVTGSRRSAPRNS